MKPYSSLTLTLIFVGFCIVAVHSIPINSTGNATVDTSESDYDPCLEAACTEEKICIPDDASVNGYKCCKNNKCNSKVKCRDPGEVLNAERIPDPRKFDPKESVVYSCLKGYHLKSTTSQRPGSIYCLTNGTWTKPMPTCTKIHFKPPPLRPSPVSPPQTTVSTEKPVAQGTDTVIIVIVVLIVLLLVVTAAFIIRYKHQTGNYFPKCQREMSNAIVLENTSIPDMPANLEENAIPVNEFAQYVAVGHNSTDKKFCEEFEDIQNHTISGLTWEASLMPDNRDKNRYINIVAYDHSRAHLQISRRRQHAGLHRSSDYINANYVSSFEKPKAYIACQGPMPNTFNEFWRMVWENNVSVIIMITNLVENGRRKCDQYWPHEGREQYKHINVTLRDTDVYSNYSIRQFQIRNTKQNRRHSRGGERKILQFHYTQWPDHGTPEYILPVLTFIRKSSLANSVDSGPMVIHCSAGVGRTGAYIMLHSMMQMALSTGKININGFLRFIRTQRNYLVQTEDQYIFVHDALLSQFTCGDTECPARQLEMYVKHLLVTPSPRNGEAAKSSSNGSESSAPEVNGSCGNVPNDDRRKKKNLRERTGMEKQFMNIAHYIDRDVGYDFALRAINQGKNRVDGIVPIFRSRVPLHYRVGKEGSDYINASFVQGYRNSRMFIITQLPLQNTRNDFWQLVWDHNCSIIITIRDDDWLESDTYWPVQDQQISCSSFNVSFGSESLLSLGEEGPTTLTARDFILEATKDDYVLAVRQLDISHWPTVDELSPQFTQLMTKVVKYTDGKEGSTVVQDRFGGTSAGQLACVHTLHQQLANDNVVDVFQTVKVAYQMRPLMFTSHTHLHFIYKAMLLETNPPSTRKPAAKNAFGKITNSKGKSVTVKNEEVADKGDAKSQVKVEKINSVETHKMSPAVETKSDVEKINRNSEIVGSDKVDVSNLAKGDNLDESVLTSASEDRPLLSCDDKENDKSLEDEKLSFNDDDSKDELLSSPISSSSEKNDIDHSTVTENTLLLEE